MGEAVDALSPRPEADDDMLALAQKLSEQAAELMAAAGQRRTAPAPDKRPPKRRHSARRTKTEHTGVKLVEVRQRAGSDLWTWVARFRDPDTRRRVQVSLDAIGKTTEEAREAWAITKAQALTKRRADLLAGAVPHSQRDVSAAVDDYIKHSEKTKRPGTVEAMRPALARFVEWAARRGLRTTDEVKPTDLGAFREEMKAASRLAQVAGAKRGTRRTTDKRLSPVSVNSYLKAVKGCLNWLRRTGLLAHVTSGEAVKEAMGAVSVDKTEPEFLTAAQVRALLAACIAHDDARCKLSREEHDGLAPAGSTPRHTSIAPFVCFVLLTGCRVGEALSLEWPDVDLDALDDSGRAVGAVRVTADKSKTHAERSIGLEVSSGLRALLAAMRAAVKAQDRAPVGRVFSEHSESSLKRALERLARPAPGPGARQRAAGYGAPAFAWHTLRRTCGTYLVCAPSIYGSASTHLAARQLGHSVEVAQKSYLGRVRGIAHGLTTLDDVFGIGPEIVRIIARGAGGQVDARTGRDERVG